MSLRSITRRVRGLTTRDGAGVKLERLVGTSVLPDLDPFLMLDLFGTDRPQDYLAGFPDHPHRGFETVTYMLEGRMRHRDNHGHEGLLGPGSVQWMSAGRGIVHSEMPEQQDGRMRGFQLWINLPAKDKMAPPRYQEFAPDEIPVADVAEGVRLKLIAGQSDGLSGPVRAATEPLYADLTLAAGAGHEIAVPPEHQALLCVFEGALAEDSPSGALSAVAVGILGAGDRVALKAGAEGARMLVLAGRPLREPVARYGPFVMNTREEIVQAFRDYEAGRL